MSEQDTTTAVVESTDDSANEAPATDATAEAPVVAGEEALGEPGKKALDAMKAKWRDAEAARKQHEADLAALRAQVEGREAEHKATLEAQRVKDEALAAANERILKAEVRAASAKKLADPADALRFLNLSDFEVGADGEVDASLIVKAIDDLITTKPYLAAQGSQRFQGSADGGARNGSATPAQLTQADMARMTPEQIVEADGKGQFDDLRKGA